MSKVISFRLNQDNPREAEALTVLHQWLEQGFNTRHTMTVALLNLDSANSQATDNGTLIVLSNQIQELLESIEVGSTFSVPEHDISSREKLSDGFVSSILKVVKPGLRPEA